MKLNKQNITLHKSEEFQWVEINDRLPTLDGKEIGVGTPLMIQLFEFFQENFAAPVKWEGELKK